MASMLYLRCGVGDGRGRLNWMAMKADNRRAGADDSRATTDDMKP